MSMNIFSKQPTRFIRDIYIGYQDIDWLSYRVDRDFATYANQIPFGTDLNNFTEVRGTRWSLGEAVRK